jgi:cephalosporin-C deacetylase-like acetyl esterase
LLQTPPPLCDFEQWIDTEIKEAYMQFLQGLNKWDAERLEILEKRRREEAAEKEHKEE